jgi:hypothetical protein
LSITILTVWSDISLWFGFLFTHLLVICMSSLENDLFKSVAYFVIGLLGFLPLSCRCSLAILDINALSDKWLANVFSFPLGCHSINGPLTVQKPFSLTQVYLSIFAFAVFVLWSHIQNSLPWLMSRNFFLLFSSSFVILSLAFQSLIHIEFLYIVWGRGPISFFFLWVCNFPNTIYWRDCLARAVFLAPLLKASWL